MADLPDKLKALLTGDAIMTGRDWQRRVDATERQRREGAFEIDTVVPGEPIGDDEVSFYRVRTELPLDAQHGHAPLRAVLDVTGGHIAFSARDDGLSDFDAHTAVFMDTETTGLMGGAGTVAFLVGAARVEGDRVILDQCFMRDFDEEEPMLAYLDEVFRGSRTLVTYNGKSFDAPLLRTRFIQNRMRPSVDAMAHLDLVHAARRFWRLRLSDCTLTQVERSVLGITRQGDIPSAEIPQIWLDYVRTRDARRLDRVFYHHRMDILSLIALTAHLSRTVGSAETAALEHNEDQLSLVRVCYLQKRYAEVLAHGRRLLEQNPDAFLLVSCLRMMAFAAKRTGAWEEMVDAWQGVLDVQPGDIDARIELCKHYEHRLRDLARAEESCAEALATLARRAPLDRALCAETTSIEAVRTRLERIRRKRAGGLRRRPLTRDGVQDDALEADEDLGDETP